MQKGRKGKREAGGGTCWSGLIVGVVLAALGSVFLLGICAVMTAVGAIPEGGSDGWVLSSCAAGSFVGGRATVCGKGKGVLVWSLGVAVLTAVVLGLTGFLLYGGLEMQRCIAVSAACLCGGGLSAVMGGARDRKRGRNL